jgi:hypothetical protein
VISFLTRTLAARSDEHGIHSSGLTRSRFVVEHTRIGITWLGVGDDDKCVFELVSWHASGSVKEILP